MLRFRFLLPLAASLLTCVLSRSAYALDRSAIPDKYKWKTEHIFPSVEAWQNAMQSVRADIDSQASYQGTLTARRGVEGAQNLIAYNRLSEKNTVALSRISSYAVLNYMVSIEDPVWSSRFQQASDLSVYASEKLAWQDPELLKIPKDTLLKWTNEYPELKAYRQRYENLFALQAHTLSEPEEHILALAGNITGSTEDIFTKLVNVDMDFPTIVDDKGDSISTNYAGWRESWRAHPNRRVREDYSHAVFRKYDRYGNSFAAMIAAQYKKDVFLAKARKYDNTLQAALMPSFIPEEVYLNLIQTIHAHLEPLHKYEAIRKRVLGVEHYTLWDDFVGLAPVGENKCRTWEDGVAIVTDALKPLGEKYDSDLVRVLDPAEGWVDPFTNPGKLAGAWSHAVPDASSYMLFNFDYEKDLSSEQVSTIAHEAGHTLNANYVQQNQPIPLRDGNTLTGEIPSTINEVFLSMKLLDDARSAYQRATGKEKERERQKLISLLDSELNSGREGIFREVMFAEWELKAHKLAEEGKPITQENLCELWADLAAQFYGPVVEHDKLSNMFWAAYPHFYMGYYVYSYAVGGIASYALAHNIRAEFSGDRAKRGSTERYLNFLKAGSTKHPVELLQDAGVDMTTPAPIEEYIKYFSSLVDELDQLTQPARH